MLMVNLGCRCRQMDKNSGRKRSQLVSDETKGLRVKCHKGTLGVHVHNRQGILHTSSIPSCTLTPWVDLYVRVNWLLYFYMCTKTLRLVWLVVRILERAQLVGRIDMNSSRLAEQRTKTRNTNTTYIKRQIIRCRISGYVSFDFTRQLGRYLPYKHAVSVRTLLPKALSLSRSSEAKISTPRLESRHSNLPTHYPEPQKRHTYTEKSPPRNFFFFFKIAPPGDQDTCERGIAVLVQPERGSGICSYTSLPRYRTK